jgi:Fe-Mn family superoxide dismutase
MTTMNFEVAPLPFAKDALEPVMSRETFDYHYEKHHKAYMAKLKSLVEGTPEADKSLEQIIRSSSGGVFNNAAQVWNHSFFWQSLKPAGGGEPKGELASMITRDFGGWDKFRQAWVNAGMGRFGSGWVWLVSDNGSLKILDTPNAETPLTTSAVPLLTADVWEHAYYIDFRNARQAFLEAFCDKLINWDFVSQNLKHR